MSRRKRRIQLIQRTLFNPAKDWVNAGTRERSIIMVCSDGDFTSSLTCGDAGTVTCTLAAMMSAVPGFRKIISEAVGLVQENMGKAGLDFYDFGDGEGQDRDEASPLDPCGDPVWEAYKKANGLPRHLTVEQWLQAPPGTPGCP